MRGSILFRRILYFYGQIKKPLPAEQEEGVSKTVLKQLNEQLH